MSNDQMSGKVVRKMSLKELTKETIGFEPAKKLTPNARRKTPNNYFAVLDAGRDFLLWKKRCGQAVKYLPKDIGALLLEMEKIVQQMNMTAIEDGYDYDVHYNECYFGITEIGNLSCKISHQLNIFLKKEKSLPDKSPKEIENFVSQLQKLSGVNQTLMKSAKLFMSQLEREYDFGGHEMTHRSLNRFSDDS